MKGKIMNPVSNLLVPLVLGLICAAIVYATFTGKTLPLIASPKSALIALLILGMAMCTAGIGQVGQSGRWTAPLAIVGMVLGAALLVIIAAALFGWKLPLIQSETQAVGAVAILIGIKYVIGTASYFFHWL